MALKPPTSSIDWDFIGLQGFDQTSHVEVTYSAGNQTWTTPRLIADPHIRVHGLSPALNYGQQCYEGMRASRASDGRIHLFRPHQHAQRMAHSANVVAMPPVPGALFIECIMMAVRGNSEFVPPHGINASLYIRPLLFGSGGQLLLSPPEEFTFCVFVQPISAMYGDAAVSAVVLENFDRAAPRGVGHAKIGGNYAPVMKWSQQAMEDGYTLTLHLDAATHTEIDEFSSSAFAGLKVRDGHVTIVIPNSPNVINSITVDSSVRIAKELGWTVEKRAVKWDELAYFDEVIALGTATMIIPISSITRPSRNQTFQYCEDGDSPSSYCQKLRVRLLQCVMAADTARREWLVEVQSSDAHVRLDALAQGLIETCDSSPVKARL